MCEKSRGTESNAPGMDRVYAGVIDFEKEKDCVCRILLTLR